MVPSPKLLWVFAVVAVPASIFGGLMPGAGVVAVVLVLLLVGVAVMDALISRFDLEGLTVKTPDLVRLYRDREGTFPLQFVFAKPVRQVIRVAVPLPESMVTPEEIRTLLVEAVDASEITWTCTGHRRGRYPIDGVFVEAPSRIGLWSLRRKCPVTLELRVYPNLHQPDALNALRRGAQGMNILRQVGKGREFEKLREYHAGDGYDEIHWKATARRGKPITKVFQVERTQEIYVVIDSSRLSGRPAGKDITLERYIQAALVLGSAAERNGDLFGLVTFSDQVHGFVRARNGKAHYSSCRDSLYQLEPRQVSPDFDEVASFLRLRLRRRALVVFLTELDDPLLAESFSRAVHLLAGQHVVLVGMLKPDGVEPLYSDGDVKSESDIYERLGGHLAWRGLKETEITLRRQGAWFSLFSPDTVCQQLVSTYVDIKQRQII